MKLLQINTTVNSGSTGRIAEDIGLEVIKAGNESYIAASIINRPSKSNTIQIGTKFDKIKHGLTSRLLDRHGFGSVNATRKLLNKIEQINPDIIHLHNIHGYYLHIGILFTHLKKIQKPVVWTFHDCWPFTGHCSHFDRFNCLKWQTECHHCPNIKGYPASYGLDQSKRNFHDKKQLFNGLHNLQIVAPSKWMGNHVQQSFLKNYPLQIIHNGISINNVKIEKSTTDIKKKLNLVGKEIILGVANTWKKRRAFNDFIKLSKYIKPKQQIVLVGLEQNTIERLPDCISGVTRTDSISELSALYYAASVFVNPTYVDNFPTTNIESLACGTPVITYNTGGSPEAIDENTGRVVEKGNIQGLVNEINEICDKGKEHWQHNCRKRAEELFDKNKQSTEYIKIYQLLINS